MPDIDLAMGLRVAILIVALGAAVSVVILFRYIKWLYLVPILAWVIHVLAFDIFTILLKLDLVNCSVTYLNLWSNAIRLQVLFTIIFASHLTLRLLRR